jgi:hypothetical protein
MLLYFALGNRDKRKVLRADDLTQFLFAFLGFQAVRIAGIECRFTAASPSNSETVCNESVCILAQVK